MAELSPETQDLIGQELAKVLSLHQKAAVGLLREGIVVGKTLMRDDLIKIQKLIVRMIQGERK